MKRRDFFWGAGALLLSSCMKADYPRATEAEVQRFVYRSDEPPSISLLSMISEKTGRSEHSGILINGSQRVLYDPAGSYWVRNRPRKDDIHYGMTDKWVRSYESFHARWSYFVRKQTKYVPLEVADRAIALSQQKGETYETQCASSASWVLRQLPGFGSIRQTMWPNQLLDDFSELPGLVTVEIHEDDMGKNIIPADQIENYDPKDTAPPRKPEFGRGEG